MDLRRYYYINQVEYAQNFVFKRNHPIHSIFERSCDLGLARITTHRIAHIFGWCLTRRTKGKHQVVLDQMDHGHHVLRLPLSRQGFRVQCSAFRRDPGQGSRFSFLNPEPLNAELCGACAAAVNDRFADSQAENLNVEIEYPLLETLAQPCHLRSQRIAGIPPLRGGVFRGSDVQRSGKRTGCSVP